MSDLKTTANDRSVTEFIDSVSDDAKRQDSYTLLAMHVRSTGQQPKMWGTSIIGFGQYHYKSERSSQQGDWPLAAFSPRKHSLTLYIMPGFDAYNELLNKLGKYKTSVGCLYINKLADIDSNVLEQLIKRSYEDAKKLNSPHDR